MPRKRAAMDTLGKRIIARLEALDISNAEAARRVGESRQRFGGYVHDRRLPDIHMLCKIARALETTPNVLLGFSEDAGAWEAVVRRILELDGRTPEEAAYLAHLAREAVSLTTAVADEGDVELRSRLAAQASWHFRHDAKPR